MRDHKTTRMPPSLIGMDIIMQRDLQDLVSSTLDRKFEVMPPNEKTKMHVPKIDRREDSGIFRGKSPGLLDMSSLKQSITENIDSRKNKRMERRGSLDSFDSNKVRRNVRRVARKGSSPEVIDGALVNMPPLIKIVHVPSAA